MLNIANLEVQQALRLFGHLIVGASRGILFGGDRLTCCDEAVILKDDSAVVGIATLAPEGEGTGVPTIVGIYIVPEMRKRGYGVALMKATLERCRERGFARVRIDPISPGGMKVVDHVSKEYGPMLIVNVASTDAAIGNLL